MLAKCYAHLQKEQIIIPINTKCQIKHANFLEKSKHKLKIQDKLKSNYPCYQKNFGDQFVFGVLKSNFY